MALAMVGLTAFAPPASAQVPVPSVSTTCEGLTVDLVNYQIDPTGTNGVIVLVNGVKIANNPNFGTSYNKWFPFVAGQTNAYMVMVKAWDDPTGTLGYTKNFQGTVDGCAVPPAPTEVKATMNLTYMTACAPDTTNTWRIRNGSTFAVPFTLEYVGQSMLIRPPNGAPVGDSFLETPRQDATAILRWGGGDSGIIAGSVTKASGNDEVSATCAGDKPADKVITKDVGAPDCGVTTVKTEITTITSALEGNKWIEQAPVITYGTRTLTSEEMVLFQNTNPGGACYKAPPTKDATTVVTTAKWACNDKTAVTSSVTTAYSFAFDSKTGTYGPAIPKAGAPVAGVRNLTATEFVACPVTEIVPAAPQNVLASTGADVTPWGVGAGLLALLTGAGLLIARKKA